MSGRRSVFQFFRKHSLTRQSVKLPSPAVDKTPQKSEKTFLFRENKPEWAVKIGNVLESKAMTIISVICTIVSLLAYDFTIAFLPKSADISTDVVLLIVFTFFIIELILYSLFRPNYLNSFWFWLDLIALISMIPDLTLLLKAFGGDEGSLNLVNTAASKAGRSGRSAATLKAVRMIRFSRLLRVLRVFRFFQAEDDAEDVDENPVDGQSSKLGQIVSEAVTKKVIMLVLALVLILPWFDPAGNSYSDAASTAADLWEYAANNGGDANAALSIFSNVGADILSVQLYDDGTDSFTSVFLEASTVESRRDVELWTYTMDGGSYVTFDIRDGVFEEAGLGMCLTLFAIVIFATSTVFVTNTTMSLVVTPVAQLTDLLLRMAGVIGLLGGGSELETMLQNTDELHVVGALCQNIMGIFGVHDEPPKKNTTKGGPIDRRTSQRHATKAIGMMASKKVTRIANGDRVLEIDVREKHRTSKIIAKVKDMFRDFQRSGAAESDEYDSVASIKEFENLQLVVANPVTRHCLRMYMTGNLTLNNLLFVLEAEQWQNDFSTRFETLYSLYCDDRSPAQINLNARQFGEIKKVYNGDETLTTDVFKVALSETWKLMEVNIYKSFLNSDYAKFYLFMKKTDPVTLSQLQFVGDDDGDEATEHINELNQIDVITSQ